MSTFFPASPTERVRTFAPGILACLVIAAAAMFLSEHYGAPVMLFALLLGIAMNFLSSEGACAAGIDFTGRTILRWGVALLGLRITLGDIAALGWQPAAGVVGSVTITILVSIAAARLMGFRWRFGLLSGGATAICGASAALAISAALPPNPQRQLATSFTVIGVSTLSTVAMVLYPIIVRSLELDSVAAGIFLGGTIHDVAQVVGAGYSMSKSTGDTATVIKLLRVAMLLPVIILTVALTHAPREPGTKRPPLLPWFAVVFIALVAINSLGWIPQPVAAAGGQVSSWCLVSAIAAIGAKTQLKELATVGPKPIILMVGETILLAAIVLGTLRFYG